MDALNNVIYLLRDFAKDSVCLFNRCHKPDCKQFTKVALCIAINFAVMGFIELFVKLIFISIKNIIVCST
ncbi:protein transport protein Sec61 subunit gamma-1-like [Gossypium raimondii]|uniref:Protein transport protein Sec61 subunit gamma-1-like n=1 Tax=Gossypium hirsutum TaxID=3635 RepID=A0A1U8N795_GOSHI|nr:protein transport protein Sec61 subunit gamma-1-like [Gossypium raimondii]XP_016734976.1 protein transport protein Sec61 subunit gamma-1-like [Gossypium hirsutum]